MCSTLCDFHASASIQRGSPIPGSSRIADLPRIVDERMNQGRQSGALFRKFCRVSRIDEPSSDTVVMHFASNFRRRATDSTSAVRACLPQDACSGAIRAVCLPPPPYLWLSLLLLVGLLSGSVSFTLYYVGQVAVQNESAANSIALTSARAFETLLQQQQGPVLAAAAAAKMVCN